MAVFIFWMLCLILRTCKQTVFRKSKAQKSHGVCFPSVVILDTCGRTFLIKTKKAALANSLFFVCQRKIKESLQISEPTTLLPFFQS